MWIQKVYIKHFAILTYIPLWYILWVEAITIPDYQTMYLHLFNAVTDAIESIEQQNYGAAKEQLIHAQQEAEEIYISEG